MIPILSDPTFWFSTVIVGIIVGVMGNVTTDQLKKAWAHFSDSQKKRNQEQERAFINEVQVLIKNPEKITDLKIEAIYFMLSNIVKIMLYLTMILFIFIFPMGIDYVKYGLNLLVSIIAASTAISTIKHDEHTRSLLREYDEQVKKHQNTNRGN